MTHPRLNRPRIHPAHQPQARSSVLRHEIAAESSERGHAVGQLIRRLMIDPEIPEHERGIIIGAALAQFEGPERGW